MAQSVGQRTLVCATCRLRFRSKTHEFTGPEALDVRRVSALVVGCPEVGILGVGSERFCCVFAGASAARAQGFCNPALLRSRALLTPQVRNAPNEY